MKSVTMNLTIPRWVVYFQAALLGIVATTFFLFGVMVGHQTAGISSDIGETFDCQISGTVQYKKNGKFVPDAGAIVFLLPRDRQPAERAPANLVSPSEFQPLQNPGIDAVHQLGGAIGRVNEAGDFHFIVDGSHKGIEYFVLVVSGNPSQSTAKKMTKQQVAAISTFFLPVERVLEGHPFHWSSVVARRPQQQLPAIQF